MSAAVPTVHLVDDDAPCLLATSRLLRSCGFTVRTFSSAQEFLSTRDLDAPGCVLSDMRMPGMDGIELQAELARSLNPLPIIFLSGQGDIPSSVRAMRAGAVDFLEKCAPTEQLIEALHRALARDAQDRATHARLRTLRLRFAALSPRELEVLGQVVRGRLNKQIAKDLGIHERTVKLHRTAITTKVQVHSVAELTRLSDETGLFAGSVPGFQDGVDHIGT